MSELLNNEPITDLQLKRLLERITATLLLANLTESQKSRVCTTYTQIGDESEGKLEIKLYDEY